MKFKVHKEAKNEFLELPEKVKKALDEEIKSRKRRDKGILSQRGTGTSYDSHGEPVNYFKLVEEERDIYYRVFFDINDGEIIMLGIRPRDDDTYINLREYTRLVK